MMVNPFDMKELGGALSVVRAPPPRPSRPPPPPDSTSHGVGPAFVSAVLALPDVRAIRGIDDVVQPPQLLPVDVDMPVSMKRALGIRRRSPRLPCFLLVPLLGASPAPADGALTATSAAAVPDNADTSLEDAPLLSFGERTERAKMMMSAAPGGPVLGFCPNNKKNAMTKEIRSSSVKSGMTVGEHSFHTAKRTTFGYRSTLREIRRDISNGTGDMMDTRSYCQKANKFKKQREADLLKK